MEMFAVAPNENSESLPQQWRAASSGWLVMWWFQASFMRWWGWDCCRRAEKLQKSPNLLSTSRMVGWSIQGSCHRKNTKFQSHSNLPVAVPPRDFWSSTYCPPQSAAMILWTRLVSWGSTNPAKGCLKPTNIFEVFNMVKIWILYSTSLNQSSKLG